MFFTSAMLERMPIAFASSSLLAGTTWGTLIVLLGIAVLGSAWPPVPERPRRHFADPSSLGERIDLETRIDLGHRVHDEGVGESAFPIGDQIQGPVGAGAD